MGSRLAEPPTFFVADAASYRVFLFWLPARFLEEVPALQFAHFVDEVPMQATPQRDLLCVLCVVVVREFIGIHLLRVDESSLHRIDKVDDVVLAVVAIQIVEFGQPQKHSLLGAQHAIDVVVDAPIANVSPTLVVEELLKVAETTLHESAAQTQCLFELDLDLLQKYLRASLCAI